jgi:hypothetical protein
MQVGQVFDPSAESGRGIDRATASRPKLAICEETSRACRAAWGRTLEAVVLTGSMARDEASFLAEHARWRLLGDAEFVLAFETAHRLPNRSSLAQTARQIEAQLEKRGITASIELSVANRTYLSTLKPHLYGYELRSSGRVVWGNPLILSSIPQFSPLHIPLEDVWRLLCNRIVEQVQVAGQIADTSCPLPLPARYRTMKLYLDMAKSLLLFLGICSSTYRGRCMHLKSLAKNSSGPGRLPFPLSEFTNLVEACTEWKLSPRETTPCDDRNVWIEGVNYARLLWRWELDCLTGSPAHASDRDALFHWMRLQPLHRRLRGWASVWSKCGWRRSISEWPRWAWRFWRASPRYWVYAAATELIFSMPYLLGENAGSSGEENWGKVRKWLPVLAARRRNGESDWQLLASDITWNYQQFLTKTAA